MSQEVDLSAEVLRDIDHTLWYLNFRGSSCLSQQMPFRFIVG